MIEGSSIEIKDVQKEVEKEMKTKVLENLPKVTNTLKLNDDGMTDNYDRTVDYVVRCFGVRTPTKEAGIQKMAKIIDKLGTKYKFKGMLGPVMQIPLAEDWTNTVFYVALGADDAIRAEQEQFIMGNTTELKTYLASPEEIDELYKKEK